MSTDDEVNREERHMERWLQDVLLPGHGRMLRSTCSEVSILLQNSIPNPLSIKSRANNIPETVHHKHLCVRCEFKCSSYSITR